MATYRAFAQNDTAPTGFTKSTLGNLIYETTQGSATVELGPSSGGPGGVVFWSGPNEDNDGDYIVAYAPEGGAAHTGANGVSSKVGFWKAGSAEGMIALGEMVSNLGIDGFAPATYASAGDAINGINSQAPSYYAYAV